MPQDTPPAPGPLPERFQPTTDASGTARDQLLDRPVTLRQAAGVEAAALQRQARLLARLEHAGVPAVHDLIAGPDGSLLVQRRVEGVTLAEAIAAAAAGMAPPELATPAAAVQTMLKLCDVLAAAHARGVVHRRVAPTAVVLSSHGQVLLPDWSAAQATEPATPRPDGRHEDLQGAAACLLAALLKRLPGAGGPAALLAEGEASLPAPLALIIRRALASSAAEGYPGMPELAQDLTRWLEGQAVQAGDGGRSCRRPLALIVAAVAVLAALAALVWSGGQLGGSWRLTLAEDFADPAWKNRWSEPPNFHGMFKVEGRRLVSTAERSANIYLKQHLTAPVAIEYTGEMLPGSEPCDLSMSWNEGVGGEDGTGSARTLGVQVAGWGNSGHIILLSGNRLPVAYKAEKLVNAKRYRIRVEIEDVRVSLYLDGELKLRHEDVVPFVAGRIGLYAHYPGKAFEDVRIFQKTPPAGISPCAVGDHYLLQREHAKALPFYEQVMQTRSDSHAQQARYRYGLAQWRMEQRAAALESWRPLAEPALRRRADAYALLGAQDDWMREGFPADFASRWRGEVAMRPALLDAWMLIVDCLAGSEPDPRLTDRLLALREQLFPEDDRAEYAATNLLITHGRYEDCMQRFPNRLSVAAGCLLALGRSGEVLERQIGDVDSYVKAYQMRGEFIKLIETKHVNPVLRALALCKLGRGEELLNDPELRYPVLLHLGRAEDLLAAGIRNPVAINEALISLGRWAEAAGAGIPECPGSGNNLTAKLLLGDPAAVEKGGVSYLYLKAAEAGDAKSRERHRTAVALPRDLRYHNGWFTAVAAMPLIERLAGDAKALESLRGHLDLYAGIYGKRPWYLARALLGEVPPEAALEMPAVTEREAWCALLRGMCAELAGDAVAARTAYQAFVALPLPKRLLALNTPDPEVEWFVRWRLRTLGSPNK